MGYVATLEGSRELAWWITWFDTQQPLLPISLSSFFHFKIAIKIHIETSGMVSKLTNLLISIKSTYF